MNYIILFLIFLTICIIMYLTSDTFRIKCCQKSIINKMKKCNLDIFDFNKDTDIKETFLVRPKLEIYTIHSDLTADSSLGLVNLKHLLDIDEWVDLEIYVCLCLKNYLDNKTKEVDKKALEFLKKHNNIITKIYDI